MRQVRREEEKLKQASMLFEKQYFSSETVCRRNRSEVGGSEGFGGFRRVSEGKFGGFWIKYVVEVIQML